MSRSIKSHIPFSATAVECLFLWFTGILSFFAVWTVICQITRASFQAYSLCAIAAACVITVVLGFVCIDRMKKSTVKDIKVVLFLFLAGLASSLITSVSHRPDADDYYYVPNAVYHLQHPKVPMDFVVHSLAGADKPIVSYAWGTASAFEYMQAAFAFILKREYLFFYYILTPALIGFLIPLGLFTLFSCFTRKPRLAAAAAVVTVGVVLLLGDTHRTFGNLFLTRVFQGKVVCLTLGLSLFIAQTIRFFRRPSLFLWACLFMTITAMAGVTTSTFILFPPLAVVLVLAMIMSRQNTGLIRTSLLYFSAFAYLGAALLFFLKYSIVNLGLSSPVNYGWPTTFAGHARFFFNSRMPATPVAVFISTGLALLWSTKARRVFLAAWIAGVIILYLNPLSAYILIRHVIIPNVYWRMFYLYPFPLLLGIAVMEFMDRFGPPWRRAALVLFVVLMGFFNAFPDSPSSFYYNVHFAWPHVKLPDDAYRVAEKAAATAPRGTMLAPPDVCGIVPMLSSEHPQMRIRNDGEKMWLGDREADMRIRASDFVGTGDEALFPQFQMLMERRAPLIESIVIKSEVLNRPPVRSLIASRGFDASQTADGYTVVWKN